MGGVSWGWLSEERWVRRELPRRCHGGRTSAESEGGQKLLEEAGGCCVARTLARRPQEGEWPWDSGSLHPGTVFAGGACGASRGVIPAISEGVWVAPLTAPQEKTHYPTGGQLPRVSPPPPPICFFSTQRRPPHAHTLPESSLLGHLPGDGALRRRTGDDCRSSTSAPSRVPLDTTGRSGFLP